MRARGGERGLSTIEVLTALVIVGVVTLFSAMASARIVDISAGVLGLIGKYAGAQKPARLHTIGSMWIQAQLEYARQLGFQGECDQSSCTWYLAGPSTGLSPGPYADCSGTPASYPNASILRAVASSPPLPPDFPYGRLVVSWDPNTPHDASNANYLQLLEVDVYRTASDCLAQSAFLTGYTGVGK